MASGPAFFAEDESDRAIFTDAAVVSLNLPAGSFVVTAEVEMENRATDEDRFGGCNLPGDSPPTGLRTPTALSTRTLVERYVSRLAGPLAVTCSAGEVNVTEAIWVTDADLIAIKVDYVN